MDKKGQHPDESGYVLLPSVTHPQGRERAFEDAFKAMMRFMVEDCDNPAIGYAIDKTDRVVTQNNMNLLSPEDLSQWNDACEEFEDMPPEEQQVWMDKVLEEYPRVDQLPEPEGYNLIN